MKAGTHTTFTLVPLRYDRSYNSLSTTLESRCILHSGYLELSVKSFDDKGEVYERENSLSFLPRAEPQNAYISI